MKVEIKQNVHASEKKTTYNVIFNMRQKNLMETLNVA
jgi:hypothetical protein